MGELVLVTGAGGFLASHAIDQLLREGYRVRGTVRDLKKSDKVDPIRKLGQEPAEGEEEPQDNPNIELVEADLAHMECWPKAVEGCDYVLHIACVNPPEHAKNPDMANKIAVDGTVNVLRACADAGVKRVVFTSTLGAITFGNPKPPNGREKFTEEDWVDPEKLENALMKSKILAEQAAWDFVKSLEEEEGDKKLELAVLHPGLVLGPLLTRQVSVSVQLLQSLLKRELMLLPRISFAISDVRDLAQAHIAAMTSPEAVGKRHIASVSEPMWLGDMAKVMNKDFKRFDFCVPEYYAPYPLMWIMGRFLKDVKGILPLIGQEPKYDNTQYVEVLGITPRDPEETILDTAYSLFESGLVPKPKKYKPRGEDTEERPEEKEDKPEEEKADAKEDIKEDIKEKVQEKLDDETKEDTPKEAEEKPDEQQEVKEE